MFKGILIDRDGDFNPIGAILLLVGGLIVLSILLVVFPFSVVGAGERGVVTRVGAYNRTIGPGIHWVTPIIEGVSTFDVQTQKEQVDASAASADLQTVNTTVAINYNVDPMKVDDLYIRVGEDYKGKVIDPAIQEIVKAVTAQYTAEELLTKRPEVTSLIQSELAARLVPNDIIVTAISITDFQFSDSFNQAIEAKVTAEQNALAAKNKLDQVKYEAEQTITSAQAQAEAIKIQAQAINSQGGADYVALQKIKQWDGKGCTSYCGIATMFITPSN